MKAIRPYYSPVIKVLQKLQVLREGIAENDELEVINEILQRLRRLDNLVGQLVNINNSFIENMGLQTEFDPETDTVTYRKDGVEQEVKLKRADPNIPITMKTLAVGGAYKSRQNNSEISVQSKEQKMILETLLEAYYQNAFRVRNLIRKLPGQKKFECLQITIVRNKLIEHPEEVEPYSFGYGSSGPVIRPMRKSERKWIDEGLVPNTENFVKALGAAFKHQIDAISKN